MIKDLLEYLVFFLFFYVASKLVEFFGLMPATVAFFLMYAVLFLIIAVCVFKNCASDTINTDVQGQKHGTVEVVAVGFFGFFITVAIACLPILAAFIAALLFKISFYTCFAMNIFFIYLFVGLILAFDSCDEKSEQTKLKADEEAKRCEDFEKMCNEEHNTNSSDSNEDEKNDDM